MAQILQFIPSFGGGLVKAFSDVWSATWWIIVPLLTFSILWEFWVSYIRYKYISRIEWILLELKVPKNTLQTPKSMEQIFAAAHAPYSYGLRFLEKYWEGKVEFWMSFEMVSLGGETHFYLRLPKQFRNLMEAAIHSQYPDATITEVSDYVKQVPSILPDKARDLWGMELILKEPNPVPIRTYMMFEEAVEERRVDPIALFTEAMAKLKEDEQIWIQILARPTGDAWRKEGQAIIDKVFGKEKPKKPSMWPTGLGLSMGDVVAAPFVHPGVEVKKKDDQSKFKFVVLNPSEKELVEGIERKTAKLGFETTIRFVYIDQRDKFSRDNVASIMGAFRQFSTQNLNLLKPDKKTLTAAVHGLFKPTRLYWRRRLIFERYRDLLFNHHLPILNIEELATIYHFPIVAVSAPTLERIESRKGGPPPTLPIVEDAL